MEMRLRKIRHRIKLIVLVALAFLFVPGSHAAASLIVTPVLDTPTHLQLDIVWDFTASSATPDLVHWFWTAEISGPLKLLGVNFWSVSGMVRHTTDPHPEEG